MSRGEAEVTAKVLQAMGLMENGKGVYRKNVKMPDKMENAILHEP